jgi:hypothetical protein
MTEDALPFFAYSAVILRQVQDDKLQSAQRLYAKEAKMDQEEHNAPTRRHDTLCTLCLGRALSDLSLPMLYAHFPPFAVRNLFQVSSP